MKSISLTVQQVEIVVSHLSDEDRARVAFDGVALQVPDNLAAAVAIYATQTTSATALAQYAAAVRYAKETGGTTVQGIPVATDDRSKQMIMGARIAADADANFTTSWVGGDGAIYPLTAPQIIGISDAVLAHVQSCFSAYATVAAAIKAGTMTTTAQIDAAFAAI